MSVQSDAPILDCDILIGPVRAATDCPALEITTWHSHRIPEGAGTATRGLYRLTGIGSDAGTPVPWTLVLKVLQAAGEADPASVGYGGRELHAYRSGLLDDLPGGVRAPRCYGTLERPGGEAWLWLEDIRETAPLSWPLSSFAQAARTLGRFNGAYLTDHPLPSFPWLSQGKVGHVGKGPTPEEIARALASPLAVSSFSARGQRGLERLGADHDTLVAALQRLPQTFCHHDAWRGNLFLDCDVMGRPALTAIDWAEAGYGAIGEDLAPLVAGSLLFYAAKLDQARELDALAYSAYLDGLRAAGWNGAAEVARFGYTASVAIFYGLGGGVVLPHAAEVAEERAWWERATHHSMEDLLERFGQVLAFFLERGDEARRLLTQV